MANLYEVKAQYLQLMDMDIKPEVLEATLEGGLADELEDAIGELAAAYKNLNAEAAMYKAEADRLKEEADLRKGRAARIKNRIDETMRQLNLDSCGSGLHKVSYRMGRPSLHCEEDPGDLLAHDQYRQFVKTKHTLDGFRSDFVRFLQDNPHLQCDTIKVVRNKCLHIK